LPKSNLSVSDLRETDFFLSVLKKPDFQRETSEWDSEKICDLIETFLNGELIPAIILWRSAYGYNFVIDGSHRLSALVAWINDDYGDGSVSKKVYDGLIPDDQLKIADKTREIVNKRIGAYRDYTLAVTNPEKVKQDVARRAKNLGALAIQLQWVEGDAAIAETSFFKINQQGTPLNHTEKQLLQSRKKPRGITARAIIHAGKGHKYWAKFSDENQKQIQDLAKEINDILFTPSLKTPIKTMDLPIGGKLYSSQTLPLIVDFVKIANEDRESLARADQDDSDGSETTKYLTNCRKLALRINSLHPSSLGLHPIVYFYSQEGRHKIASFFAITALINELEKRNMFEKFTTVRRNFEELLLSYDYLVQQIVRRYREAVKSYPYMKQFYFLCIEKLSNHKTIEQTIDEIIAEKDFKYLTKSLASQYTAATLSKDFSDETKSAVFVKQAIGSLLKCRICGGYLHQNSISIDHIQRKMDGGTGSLENAQLTHPYCNSTIKN